MHYDSYNFNYSYAVFFDGIGCFCPCDEECTGGRAILFAPLYDIDEEAATGTSNGALTHYLMLNEVVKLESISDASVVANSGFSATGAVPSADCLFIQGESMGRPSAVRSHVEAGKIQVGGSAVILAEGEINI